jgi:hypothetical protein
LTSTSRIANGCAVVHQVEQGRAVIQVDAGLHAAFAEHGQLDYPAVGVGTPVRCQ